MNPLKNFLGVTVLAFGILASGAASLQAEEIRPFEIVVGTEGTMNPFTYFDEKNQLTGFDVEVVREIEKVDPNLKFKFVIGVWDSLFPGLDAGHYQMLANQIAHNKDREARYLLTDEFYFKGGTQAITLKARGEEFNDVADLKGKRVAVGVGSNHSLVLEDWNNKNGNQIEIVYYDGEVGLMFQDLLNYRVDALMNSPAVAQNQAKANGIAIHFIGAPFYDANIHFIFPRTAEGDELKQRVDRALKTLREQGVLKTLSLQFFAQDLT